MNQQRSLARSVPGKNHQLFVSCSFLVCLAVLVVAVSPLLQNADAGLSHAGNIQNRPIGLAMMPLSVSEAPLSGPDFSFSPMSPRVGQNVTFTATVSGGTPPFTFRWVFGDGGSGDFAARVLGCLLGDKVVESPS